MIKWNEFVQIIYREQKKGEHHSWQKIPNNMTPKIVAYSAKKGEKRLV